MMGFRKGSRAVGWRRTACALKGHQAASGGEGVSRQSTKGEKLGVTIQGIIKVMRVRCDGRDNPSCCFIKYTANQI